MRLLDYKWYDFVIVNVLYVKDRAKSKHYYLRMASSPRRELWI